MICEPLELECAAAYLAGKGHCVDLVDLLLEKGSLASFLKRKRYGMVCFTGYITQVRVIKQDAATVKGCLPDALTVVGGVHAEVVPEDFVDSNIDCILWANGVRTLGEIARAPSIREAGTLPGVYREGKIKPPFEHFGLPFPDRRITAKYRDRYSYIYHDECATIKTSDGCPYECSFCFCTRVCDYAARSLDDVMNELESIREDNVFIVDDDFLVDKRRLESFCSLLDERGIRKHYIAFGRADFIAGNPDIIRLLAAHGFEALFVGLESFKAEELDLLRKATSVEQNIAAVRVLEEAGVQCYGGLMVGEDWRKRDFDALIRFLNGFEHPMVNIQPITPMPGTPLYEKSRDKIMLRREDSERWDMAHLAFKPVHMTSRAFYRQILRTYLRTSASKKQRRYLRDRFGESIYKRVRRGAAKITWQYIKLIIKP